MIDKKITPAKYDSKIGGKPYWPMGLDYPTDPTDQPLSLLIQINLEDLQGRTNELPTHGILQFLERNGCTKVVYHSTIDTTNEANNEMTYPPVQQHDGINGEFSIIFEDVYLTAEMVKHGVYDEIYLLGIPGWFCQGDRRTSSNKKKYNRQLLQFGSIQDCDGEWLTSLGDAGVMHFMINSNHLVNGEFRDVYFDFDCC